MQKICNLRRIFFALSGKRLLKQNVMLSVASNSLRSVKLIPSQSPASRQLYSILLFMLPDESRYPSLNNTTNQPVYASILKPINGR
jgi:hypothetical protein